MPSLWRISADTPDYTADDMTGEGARRSGGRWNRTGDAVVYAASSISLACLETLVHMNNTLPLNRYLVEIQVPQAIWDDAQTFDHTSRPAIGWDAVPPGKVSLDAGSNWLKSSTSLLLRVPSVVILEEHNVLINPAHTDAPKLSARKIRKFLYDPRVGLAT